MIIDAATLKDLLEKTPGEYEIYYHNNPISDKVEIDLSGKRIILKND